MIIQNSTFKHNFASYGGSLSYDIERPIFDNVVFENNSANYYGQDISSYPIKIMFFKKINDSYYPTYKNESLLEIRPSKSFSISSEDVIIGLYDYDNQIDNKTQQKLIFYNKILGFV